MSRGARILLGIVALGLALLMLRMAPGAAYPLGHYLFAGFCLSIGIACFASGWVRAFFGSLVATGVVIAGLSYLGSAILEEPVISDSRATPSVLDALMFCIFFCIPASLYVRHARFGFYKATDEVPELNRDEENVLDNDPSTVWFRSDLFQIEVGEDEEINPGRYGRQLARWLQQQLESRGHAVEHICEDWGHCLMCSREPFMLWIGCGNVDFVDESEHESALRSPESIAWHCFVYAEVPFWKRLFPKPQTAEAVAKLSIELQSILDAEPRIRRVAEP